MRASVAILLVLAIPLVTLRSPAQEDRIGTFDRPAIVIAYYRSPQWSAMLKQKQAEMDEARRANDAAKIKELNEWGGKAQELAHQQLIGKAGIGNILDVLEPVFEEIEQSEDLSNIVPASAHESKTQTVDVTDRLLDWLIADEATREAIREFEKYSLEHPQ
jgi:hypothetical protein